MTPATAYIICLTQIQVTQNIDRANVHNDYTQMNTKGNSRQVDW